MKFITENNGKTTRVCLNGELANKVVRDAILAEIVKGKRDFILDFSAQKQVSENELYAIIGLARRALGEGTRVYAEGLQTATTSQKINELKQDVIDLYGVQTRDKPFEAGGFYSHRRPTLVGRRRR